MPFSLPAASPEGVLGVYENHVTSKTFFIWGHVSRHAKNIINLALVATELSSYLCDCLALNTTFQK